LNQGGHLPIEHDRGDGLEATEDAKPSEDLWERAYRALEQREPDLVTEFACLVDPTVAESTKPSLSPEIIKNIISSKLQDREAKQMIIHLRNRPIKVREQGEKVVKFILWSNEIVSQAVSAQPYAALAWSGVSILLPVSCIISC